MGASNSSMGLRERVFFNLVLFLIEILNSGGRGVVVWFFLFFFLTRAGCVGIASACLFRD